MLTRNIASQGREWQPQGKIENSEYGKKRKDSRITRRNTNNHPAERLGGIGFIKSNQRTYPINIYVRAEVWTVWAAKWYQEQRIGSNDGRKIITESRVWNYQGRYDQKERGWGSYWERHYLNQGRDEYHCGRKHINSIGTSSEKSMHSDSKESNSKCANG